MSNFWPTGIEINDTQSPREILESAQKEWETQSKGVLTLILRTAKSKNDFDMIFVDARHSPTTRTATLFEVVHRPNAPYPVTIQFKETEIPHFLKKTYYEPGLAGMRLQAIGEGRRVSNEWVADTPSEFRKKLSEAFNVGSIKNDILNLLSSPPVTPKGTNSPPPPDVHDGE